MRVRASLIIVAVLIASVAIGGCGNDPNGAGLDVSGTWTGMLTVTTTGGMFSGPAVLTLTQSGTSVTGSLDFEDDAPLSAAGSLSSATLTLVVTPAQGTSDDCHLFPVTLVFNATVSTLTATSGSGDVCEGDGVGGHQPLESLTGLSGTLTRS